MEFAVGVSHSSSQINSSHRLNMFVESWQEGFGRRSVVNPVSMRLEVAMQIA